MNSKVDKKKLRTSRMGISDQLSYAGVFTFYDDLMVHL